MVGGSETREEVGGAGMVLGGWAMVRGKGCSSCVREEDAPSSRFEGTGGVRFETPCLLEEEEEMLKTLNSGMRSDGAEVVSLGGGEGGE